MPHDSFDDADPEISAQYHELEEHKKEELKLKFKQMDRDKNDLLDFSELRGLLRSGNPAMTDREMHLLFDQVDKDKSGFVDFNEFVEYIFTKDKTKQTSLGVPKPPSRLGVSMGKAAGRAKSPAGSSQGSRSRKRRGSKGSSAASRRSEEYWADVSDATFMVAQSQAIADLSKWLVTKEKLSMLKLADKLLDNVTNKAGEPVLTKEQVKQVTLDVMSARYPDADVEALAQEVLVAGKMQHSEVGSLVANLVHQVQTVTELDYIDVAGQVLFKFAGCEPLREESMRALIYDLRWVVEKGAKPTVVELASETFKELTWKDGGKMRWKTWMKAVQLIRGNPILAERFQRNDADRLFHAQIKTSDRIRKEENVQAVLQRSSQEQDEDTLYLTLKDFQRLLLSLTQYAKVHPYITYLAIGSHAESLAEKRANGEELVPAARTSGPSSRKPSLDHSAFAEMKISVPPDASEQPGEKLVQKQKSAEELLEMERGWKTP